MVAIIAVTTSRIRHGRGRMRAPCAPLVTLGRSGRHAGEKFACVRSSAIGPYDVMMGCRGGLAGLHCRAFAESLRATRACPTERLALGLAV